MGQLAQEKIAPKERMDVVCVSSDIKCLIEFVRMENINSKETTSNNFKVNNAGMIQ